MSFKPSGQGAPPLAGNDCAAAITLVNHHDDLMVAVINTPLISDRVRKAHFADGEDWHANAAETSLMLAVAPEIARPDLAASSDDPDRTGGLVFAHPVNKTSLNGVTGMPSRASADQGHELFAWMVEDLASTIERGKKEIPPLPHSYTSAAEDNGS